MIHHLYCLLSCFLSSKLFYFLLPPLFTAPREAAKYDAVTLHEEEAQM